MANDVVEQSVGLYVCVVVYMAAMVVIGFVAFRRKKQAAEKGSDLDAHFGGQFSVTLLVLTTFSTVYSGLTVTGIPSEAYTKGFLSLRWVGATIAIVWGMLLTYPRLRRLAVTRHYRSPSDFITDRYRSRRLRIVCAICAVFPQVIYMSLQTVAFATTIEGITGGAVSKLTAMIVFAVVIVGMEKLGGMNSVVLTDAVQAAVMICAFMAVPILLGQEFGYLWQTAAAGCDSLVYVPDIRLGSAAPSSCTGAAPGCLSSGCLADVRPAFYLPPSPHEMCSIAFFLFNMIAAPLQPHMVQRVYIARSDRDLRIVLMAMLVAPFLAQTPGVLMGLSAATFGREWSVDLQSTTPFAAVSEELMQKGPLPYALAAVMTCAALAAIMSTADSVLMGASSLVSIDIYKGVINPEASTSCVVRLGELNSLLMAAIAVVGGLFISVSAFGKLIVVQNGLLMQLLPAYAFGLLTGVRERGILAGIIVAIVALVAMMAADFPSEEGEAAYVPKVNISVFVNVATVILCELFCPGSDDRPSKLAAAMQERFGDPLRPSTIRSIMSETQEPNRFLLLGMGLCLIASVPMFTPDASHDAARFAGLPVWGAGMLLCYLCALVMGFAAVLWWKPRGAGSGFGSITDNSEESDTNSTSE